MDELTFEKAKELGLTPIGCVKYYFPNSTEEECNFILWEETCFPFSSVTFLKQLYEFYLEQNG